MRSVEEASWFGRAGTRDPVVVTDPVVGREGGADVVGREEELGLLFQLFLLSS